MREDSRGILSGNMVGWQKFTRHLDKILHDRRQKLALMPRQMNGILKRKIRKIDPGNGTESQLSSASIIVLGRIVTPSPRRTASRMASCEVLSQAGVTSQPVWRMAF